MPSKFCLKLAFLLSFGSMPSFFAHETFLFPLKSGLFWVIFVFVSAISFDTFLGALLFVSSWTLYCTTDDVLAWFKFEWSAIISSENAHKHVLLIALYRTTKFLTGLNSKNIADDTVTAGAICLL